VSPLKRHRLMLNRIGACCALLALGLLLPGTLQADYLKTTRAATLKVDAAGDAEVLSALEVGVALELLADEQTSGYYHARSAAGTAGWVYRTFVRRYPGALPTSPIAQPSGGTEGTTPAEGAFTARHLKLGRPVVLYERAREGYCLAEDGRLKIPLWVQYELLPAELEGPATRGDNFQPDLSVPTPFRSELADYSKSGYDRGHMAPAADMKRSDQVMGESFLLSNMCPQNPTLNRGLWAQLEDGVRGWVRQRGTLTVISGPVFEPKSGKVSYAVIGGSGVAVPTHFFKIVVDANQTGDVQALAFLIPNEAPQTTELAKYLVSIDQIEMLTGIDFLSALPDKEEDALEASVASKLW
jgi:endonuclease G, mitochondrial